MSDFREYQRLLERYQQALDQMNWADQLHEDQAAAEFSAAFTALDTYIQEQKILLGLPIHASRSGGDKNTVHIL